MEINGKIYRNLEGQVEYLTGKWDDLQDQINDMVLTHFVVVEELPTEDIEKNAVYLVGPKGTAPDQYYEEWVYVETSEDTWNWEKLGYTTEVDLSGYLEKVETATTSPQAYVKNADGTQTMVNVVNDAYDANSLARRDSGGRIKAANPVSWNDVVIKDYAENNFVAKSTSTTTYDRLYGVYSNGTQTTFNVSEGANAYTVAMRNSAGILKTKDPVNSEDSVNLSYANDHYVGKQTGTSSYYQAYCKKPDGSQDMLSITDSAVQTTIPFRAAAGQLNLPNQLNNTPGDDQAVSKRYVDAVVGQLLYLHDLEIIITVDSTNKLYVKAYLINGSSTAITSFDRQLYRRIDVQWGAFGPDMANVEAVAVTKLPDTFRQDEFDEPFIGFLYQYISGGNLVSGKTNSSMSSTITDTVISF